jgi:hypothetical protein
MRAYPLMIIFSTLLLYACADSRDQRAQNAATRAEVTAEINRICALPDTQHQAEIDRVKREAGMAIVCPGR